MRSGHILVMSFSLLVCVACGFVIWSDARANAQTGTGKTKPKSGTSKSKVADAKEAKELEERAEKNLKSFLEDTFKLAEDYERSGKYEEAQEQLKLVTRVKPEFPGIKEKIEKLNDMLFDTNELELEHDVKESWKMHVLVSKGKPIRIDAIKDYTLQLNFKTDAAGLPNKDPRTDMASGVRCGALMGIVVPLPEPGKPPAKNDKVGEPFEIGTSKDYTPKEDGVLLLNVNLPQGHKSSGKLLVRLSGHIKTLPKDFR